ncbi:MAG: beta-propeller domain-containing protein, partial [Pyrinomonadaceae bacterium]
MRYFGLVLAAVVCICGWTMAFDEPSGGGSAETVDQASGQKKGLRPFNSEAELKAFFDQIKKKRKDAARKSENSSLLKMSHSAAAETVSVSADGAGSDSVTNVQEAGVDEGGIVKMHGDFLVVLRRGRLFTVRIGGSALDPISRVDAFGPGISPSGAWYDEMLIAGDTIVVIGYSYERGGTEIGLFKIDPAGKLSYRSTYHLRSNDYYSSRNYASRLIGNKLIFYTPMYLNAYADDPMHTFPAIRKWHVGAKDTEFERIVPATRVYKGLRDESTASETLALHTVTTCELGGGDMSCEATAVIGPPGNVFYVSGKSVYVWASDWYGRQEKAMLYRIPLETGLPGALQVSGSPIDQFSFLEQEANGRLNVLVRAEGRGNWMWRAEVSEGDVALMQVPTDSFGDVYSIAPNSSYRTLQKPEGYTFQNRFVGDFILYGTGSGWGRARTGGGKLFAARVDGGTAEQID